MYGMTDATLAPAPKSSTCVVLHACSANFLVDGEASPASLTAATHCQSLPASIHTWLIASRFCTPSLCPSAHDTHARTRIELNCPPDPLVPNETCSSTAMEPARCQVAPLPSIVADPLSPAACKRPPPLNGSSPVGPLP